ncbi:MAG TPA: Bor family protein [Bdellovibrionota bacterium]|jgi:hypothetical protein
MIFRHLTVILCILTFAACSTVTVVPAGKGKISSKPNYEDSKSFFLLGIIGEHDVNISEVCGKNGARQMQSQRTFLDGFLTVITLGIYAPKTAKVWCEKEEKIEKKKGGRV